MKDRQEQIEDFLKDAGWTDCTRTRVAGDASQRRYDRVRRENGSSAILMDAPPETGEDVRPFIQIAQHLQEIGLSAPEIFARDPQRGLLLIEDFGDALFAKLMTEDPVREEPLYRAAVDVLCVLQKHPHPDLPTCDETWLTNMLEPLFQWYASDISKKDIAQFKTLFLPLAREVAAHKPVMILRDYHAQNLLLLPDRSGPRSVGILDFQDAILGHPAYDLVSILQDARRDVSEEIEAEIIRYMIDQTKQDEEHFRTAYAVLGLQRNLRILGIFARLSQRDGKVIYVDFIPRVWGYVERNLRHPNLAPLAQHLRSMLPEPTPALLEKLKSQCPPHPSPL